jgi:hypothetical protein
VTSSAALSGPRRAARLSRWIKSLSRAAPTTPPPTTTPTATAMARLSSSRSQDHRHRPQPQRLPRSPARPSTLVIWTAAACLARLDVGQRSLISRSTMWMGTRSPMPSFQAAGAPV